KLGALGRGLDNALGISRRAAKGMEKRLVQHHRACRTVLASRIDDQLQAERAVGSGRVRPYRLGLDSVQFHPNHRDKDAFFQRFAIPPGAVVLLFVGRLDAGKNVMLLAEAVARANAAGAPLFLLAAGKGPAENDLRRLLGPRVSLPGFLNAPELAAAYAGADYLALPSMVETWSLVAAEALASGLPVIAAASSGVGRFLGAEGAGLLVHANTVEAWQSALQDAAALPHPAALRDAARRTALAHFPSWEQALIEDFVPVWQRAAAETRG
ncbi:MAG TPA: glycosyltransferase, partial [Alphaproteobacteria bacterium]|nr:glycosyltransferase [Alphaproteobacteria bacterium]